MLAGVRFVGAVSIGAALFCVQSLAGVPAAFDDNTPGNFAPPAEGRAVRFGVNNVDYLVVDAKRGDTSPFDVRGLDIRIGAEVFKTTLGVSVHQSPQEVQSIEIRGRAYPRSTGLASDWVLVDVETPPVGIEQGLNAIVGWGGRLFVGDDLAPSSSEEGAVLNAYDHFPEAYRDEIGVNVPAGTVLSIRDSGGQTIWTFTMNQPFRRQQSETWLSSLENWYSDLNRGDEVYDAAAQFAAVPTTVDDFGEARPAILDELRWFREGTPEVTPRYPVVEPDVERLDFVSEFLPDVSGSVVPPNPLADYDPDGTFWPTVFGWVSRHAGVWAWGLVLLFLFGVLRLLVR